MRDIPGESLEKLLLVLAWVNAAGLEAHLEPTAHRQQLFKAVLCVHSAAGQLTWLITEAQLPLVAHLPRSPRSHYDGAGTEKKLARLLSLIQPTIASQGAVNSVLRSLAGPSTIGPEAAATWQGKADEALKPKRPGRYDVYVSPTGSDVRVERTRGPLGLKRLQTDQAGRKRHPIWSGWVLAGTVVKR